MYKNIFTEPPPIERRALFAKLYKEHGVELVGVWRNKDNHLEYYMITKYRDEAHYNQFIEIVKQIPEYIEMTQRVSKNRIMSESVNLILEEF